MTDVTCQWLMSPVNDWCHLSMTDVTCQWLMSPVNDWCHLSMTDVTCQWLMSPVNDWCHLSMTDVTCQWLMSLVNDWCHLSMTDVTWMTCFRPLHIAVAQGNMEMVVKLIRMMCLMGESLDAYNKLRQVRQLQALLSCQFLTESHWLTFKHCS